MVTLKNIKCQFPHAIEYKRMGSKQLFIVTYSDKKFLVSYRTIIGYKLLSDNVWIITSQRYSRTTSKQTSQFIGSLLRDRLKYNIVSEADFNPVLYTLNADL